LIVGLIDSAIILLDLSLALLGFLSYTHQNEPEIIPHLYNSKKWTGWDDLNPRPQ